MAMTTIEQATAHLDRLFQNASVQDDLDRALSRARQAAAAAKRAKSATAAVKDQAVRERLRQSVAAARSAALQLKRGPEIERRRQRRKPLLVAGAVLSATVVVLLYGDLRDQLAAATSPSPEQPQGA